GLPPEKAYFVRTATSKLASLVSTGSWRTIASVGVFSATTGLLLQRDDQGDTSLVNTASSEETCTTPTYATPPPSGLNTGMGHHPGRSPTVSVTTGGPIGRGACPAPTSSNTTADTLIYYDGNTTSAGVIATVGDPTREAVIDHYSGSTPAYQTTTTTG